MTDFLSQLQRVVGAAYDIERELLGGGMSRVFVATERALARKVVIKVLPPELAAGVNMERFRREIQLAAQLHHPHIVPLLSTGEGEGILYYTMPYIEGESLRGVLERSGRFAVADVIRVLHDVIDALAYAHGRGVMHRDIKPANILRLGSHALVTDFGVAKALSAAIPVSGVTTAGFAIGTPAYMAPEQLAGDPAADQRVDLYAVGLLAYELLTGASPFSSLSPQATLTAQLTETPEPLHTVRPEVPQGLSDLIMMCLEKQPENRPATANALQAALDEVSTPRGAVFAAGAGRGRPTVARGALIGAAVVVVLSAAAYAVVVTRAGDDSGTNVEAAGGATGTSLPDSTPAASPPQPVVLSRADSLAIADAVNSRIQEQRLADGVRTQQILDSVRIEIEHAFDSVTSQLSEFRARAARSSEPVTGGRGAPVTRTQGTLPQPVLPAPQAGERRVVVLPFSANNDGSGGSGGRNRSVGFGNALSDSLRIALANRGGFAVVPESTTRTVYSRARVPSITGYLLRAPVVITGEYTRSGRDSTRVRVQIECMECRRDLARTATVRESRPTTAVAILIDSLISDLGKVEHWAWPPPGAFRGPPQQQSPGGRRGGGPPEFQRGPRTPPAPPSGQPPPP